jgi:RNA polymerase subunit RPABC4/transcription elongation factor Spt4
MKKELVSCVICKTSVSPYAHTCPSCGHPFQQSPKGSVVVVTGFDISFTDWMGIWIKASLAAIPAGVLVGFFVFILTGLAKGCLAAL